MSDVKPAQIDITIGRGGHDTRIAINGQDVSNVVSAIVIECRATEATKVTFTAIGKVGQKTLSAAIDPEQIAIVEAPTE